MYEKFQRHKIFKYQNIKIMYAHNENHFNLKYHFMKEYSRKKKLRVATKDFFQLRDVLNVINRPYIIFYFTCTYYYGLNQVQN